MVPYIFPIDRQHLCTGDVGTADAEAVVNVGELVLGDEGFDIRSDIDVGFG